MTRIPHWYSIFPLGCCKAGGLPVSTCRLKKERTKNLSQPGCGMILFLGGWRVKTESESEKIEGKHHTTSFLLHFFRRKSLTVTQNTWLPYHPMCFPYLLGSLPCVFSGPPGLDFPNFPPRFGSQIGQIVHRNSWKDTKRLIGPVLG